MTDDTIQSRLRKSLRLYNTLTASTESFVPMNDDRVRIYGCGPTVYSTPHIGNMRMYITFDVLRRVLRFAGYPVEAAMNITDVGHLTSDADAGDDKMVKAAKAERATAWEIAEKYTKLFFEFAEQLNIRPVEHVLRATDHIDEQIALIHRLDKKGVLYRTDDGMYFDTSLVPDYGKLTPNDTRDHLKAGIRVALGEKRHPTDFAVWKFSKPGDPKRDMEWDSPWGTGFPGWHIECSAMAMAYLGETLDIHVGGIDHIAIHHTNEIAQSEAVTGKPFSRWWIHGAFLLAEGEKRMGKSEGNHITLATLEEWGYQPVEYRYLALMSHYRSPVTFSREVLDSAAAAYRRLIQRVDALRAEVDTTDLPKVSLESPYMSQFIADLSEEVNTSRAIATLWNLMRDTEVDSAEKLALVAGFDEVFGLDLMTSRSEAEVPQAIKDLAARRWELRSQRQFGEADKLRDELLSNGYTVQDERDGYKLVALEE